MISRGVNSSLVSAQGFGEKDPVASNDTPEGRAKNRRVELTVAGSGN
jgi:outer membrane protein OmpA-like peptidoglycan-associated protein